MFLVIGGTAFGGAVAAVGGVRSGAGRRRDGVDVPRAIRGVQPPAGVGSGRSVQGICRCRRRDRMVGRRGRARRRATGRCAAIGASGVSPVTGVRGESRWCFKRTDRPEWAVAAAVDPIGTGQRRPDRGRRGRGRRARDGNHAGGPDRGASAVGNVRTGPAGGSAAVVGVDQIQYRAFVGRGGRGRGDQDGAGDAARGAAEDAERGCADAACGLVGGRGFVVDGAAALAGTGPAAARGSVVVRHQRHECACHYRAIPGPGKRCSSTR